MENKTNELIQPLLERAKQHGLAIDPASIKINESGLDFLAVFAKTTAGVPWVLRSPRRPDVAAATSYERDVLRFLQPRILFEVPDWQLYDESIIGYPLLGGTPLATINMEIMDYEWYLQKDALPERFYETLAQALVSLHSVDDREARAAGVRVTPAGELRGEALKMMEAAREAFGVSAPLWERWQRWLADESYWPRHACMTHGDMHPGHILVQPDGEVTGLLDWTEGAVSDPAKDFIILRMLWGEDGLRDFIARYERAGGRVWPRMAEHIAEWEAFYPAMIAAFAVKSGLPEYEAMARSSLGVE
ncbi:macrolide 2'-phosphotransferase [Paenibacillus soyae]|uniref:Macrolide 2'-phosphotransferase n=1 Tax=Paenibacillus soyae TaxID=2969249 RepID=A0A9X2N247_9BACL|nr:macrolide 2'-phosphotransferase [Paenibacillus soyae]MCR2807642.1 macrolide 2'-phosphotransferase [Paenibacillus soyae]